VSWRGVSGPSIGLSYKVAGIPPTQSCFVGTKIVLYGEILYLCIPSGMRWLGFHVLDLSYLS